MRINQEDSRIKRSLISRFKRRWVQVSWEEIKKIQESREVWFQDSSEEIKKTSQGKYWKYFSKKTNIAHFCFSKEFFSKFSKLPEFLLFGNRLPVAKFDFKSF